MYLFYFGLTIPFLVAIIDEKYRDNAQVPDFIKEYLSHELEEDKLDWVLNLFREANSLHNIWDLARNEKNKFAVHILENSDDTDLFSCGAAHFDEIEWSSDSILEEVIVKLCENGALESIHEDIREKPNAYHKAINLLTKHGNKEARDFAKSVLKNLNKKQWLEAFESDNELLSCIPDSTPTFSMAWASYFQLITSNTLDLPNHDILRKFWSLKNKVLDIDLRLEEVTKSYFQHNETDPLDEMDFMLIAPSIAPYIKHLDQRDLESRISSWIESNHMQKIKWLLDIPIGFRESHQETLVAQVEHKLSSSDRNEFQIYEKLNKKLGLSIQIPEFKDNKSQVEVKNRMNKT